MSLPDEVIRAAMLGTDKSALTLSQQSGTFGEMMGQFADGSTESALLKAVAGWKLQERAGYVPQRMSDKVVDVCEVDTAKPLNETAIRHLLLMTKGNYYNEVLPEWLREVQQTGRRVPEVFIPLLLDLGRVMDDFQDGILAVLGKRGDWLAKQANGEAWGWAMPYDVESVWANGSVKVRLEVIRGVRRQNPQRARAMIAAVWVDEDTTMRSTLIGVLDDHLSMDDEPFLENALNEKDNDVRQSVINRLRRLPESRFCQRMIERVDDLLLLVPHKEGRYALRVAMDKLPETLDKMARRDGIYVPATGHWSGTPQLSWVQQMLNFVSPRYWCEKWGITPEQLLDAVSNSSKASLRFWHAWSYPTFYQKDAEFAQLLLHTPIDSPNERPDRSALNLLVQTLDHEKREVYALDQLDKAETGFDHAQPVAVVLQHINQMWSHRLTEVFLVSLARSLSVNSKAAPKKTADKMKEFALYMPPDMKDRILNVLSIVDADSRHWQAAIEDVGGLLDFRRDMLTAIHAD